MHKTISILLSGAVFLGAGVLGFGGSNTQTVSAAGNASAPSAYICPVEACDTQVDHRHEVCAVDGCTQTASHLHNNTYYLGHHAGDGHAHTKSGCTADGCTQTGAHRHSGKHGAGKKGNGKSHH